MKGTRASWVKYGLDVQEDQLRQEQVHVSDAAFGVGMQIPLVSRSGADLYAISEPVEQQGTLTLLGADGKPQQEKVPTEIGR